MPISLKVRDNDWIIFPSSELSVSQENLVPYHTVLLNFPIFFFPFFSLVVFLFVGLLRFKICHILLLVGDRNSVSSEASAASDHKA